MRRLFLAVLAAAATTVAPAAAQDAMRQKIDEAVVEKIFPELKKGGHTDVTLGTITWEDGAPASTGAGILQALNNSLTSRGIKPSVSPAVVLHGVLHKVCDPRSEPKDAPAVKLVLRLMAGSSKVCEVPMLFMMDDIGPLDPFNYCYPPGATAARKVEILKRARENAPSPKKVKGSVLWGDDEKVGIEMLLSKTDDLRKARAGKVPEGEVDKLFAARDPDDRGRVATADGESCRFRITNRHEFAVAGRLWVAGVDWSEFSSLEENKDKHPLLLVVPANGSVVVRGWIRNGTSSLTFDVRNLPVACAGRQEGNGVVQFAYSACWKKGDKPAPGDPPEGVTLSGQTIDRGVEQIDNFTLVERVIGRPRGAVALQYGEFKDKK